MATDSQTPIGDTVELPAGATRRYEYKSDGGEFLNLVELKADVEDVIVAGVSIDHQTGSPKQIPRPLIQGDDVSSDDRPAATDETYPIILSNIIGEHRYTLLEELAEDDRIIFRFKNTDGTNPQKVTFRAAAASTIKAAGAGGA